MEPWPTEGLTIFFLGRHEPRKGLDVLLDALPRLPSDVHIWVGGEGPDTERLKLRHAGDPRVQWLGRLSDMEKRRRLKAADVFCAPSLRGESFGVVLLEAMAGGAAIVAADLSGYRLVARPEHDGLLVPPGDAEALGAALVRVLDDDSLRSRLVESGAARAQAFSMDSLADLYLDLYQRVSTPAPQAKGWRPRRRALGTVVRGPARLAP